MESHPQQSFGNTMIITICIFLALSAVTLAQQVFVQIVQAPSCFDYARRTGQPGIEFLAFSEVSIASNRNPHHTCIFTDTRTDAPVILQVAPHEVPIGIDTLQVMIMVATFLCTVLPSFAALSLLQTRLSNKRQKTVTEHHS